jgi:hypothetical protein
MGLSYQSWLGPIPFDSAVPGRQRRGAVRTRSAREGARCVKAHRKGWKSRQANRGEAEEGLAAGAYVPRR